MISNPFFGLSSSTPSMLQARFPGFSAGQTPTAYPFGSMGGQQQAGPYGSMGGQQGGDLSSYLATLMGGGQGRPPLSFGAQRPPQPAMTGPSIPRPMPAGAMGQQRGLGQLEQYMRPGGPNGMPLNMMAIPGMARPPMPWQRYG